VFRSLGVGILCAALLAACADENLRTPQYYVVRPQDTLYSIAWRNGLDYRQLAAWNRLGPSYRIDVGQRLRLSPAAGAGAVPRQAVAVRRQAAAAASTYVPRLAAAAAGRMQWVWPTDRIGPPQRLENGGLLLNGRLGQPVRAAAAGQVVYTGSGIRGFGELVIIKHSASLLSAYAYNQAVLVHEDQRVGAGQAIARMGEDTHRVPTLYFEIRSNGRTVDPLPYLLGKK